MKKRIVLCADDYVQAPAISQGIVALLKEKRLSAVSCMVNTPFWVDEATWLQPYESQADIGLHWNLTEGRALSRAFISTYGDQLFSLSTLMRLALIRKLDQAVMEAEC